jgi:hypothetical protein
LDLSPPHRGLFFRLFLGRAAGAGEIRWPEGGLGIIGGIEAHGTGAGSLCLNAAKAV